MHANTYRIIAYIHVRMYAYPCCRRPRSKLQSTVQKIILLNVSHTGLQMTLSIGPLETVTVYTRTYKAVCVYDVCLCADLDEQG